MKKKLLPYFAIFSLLLFSSITSFGQVPSYVPTDGLVGYWPFNGDAADESGNGNDGTVTGATLTTDRDGLENAAYDFNAFNWSWGSGGDYIYIPFDEDFNSAEITVSAWFLKSENYILNQIYPTIIKRYEGGYSNPNGQTWGIYVNTSDNTLNAFLLPPNTTNNYPSVPEYFGPSIENEAWQNVVLTFDGGQMIIYLNGQVETVIPTNNFILNSNGNSGISIGMSIQANGNWDPFNGKVDDIGIWNRALSEQEIEQLYSSCTLEPTSIVGETAPLNFTTSQYFCNDNPGSTYEWTVTNGVISSGQGTNNIIVLWGNEGVGSVSVVETNAEGCQGQPVLFEVSIQCTSNISAINGDSSPIILQSQTYSVNGPVESSYQWTVTNGVIASGQGTNTVNVIWAAEGEGTLSVVETTSSGCESNAVSFTANAVITNIQELSKNQFILYPNPTTDRLIIECEASMVGQEYLIYDVLGREQKKGIITNQITTIDTRTLSNGNYLLEAAGLRVKVVVAR